MSGRGQGTPGAEFAPFGGGQDAAAQPSQAGPPPPGGGPSAPEQPGLFERLYEDWFGAFDVPSGVIAVAILLLAVVFAKVVDWICTRVLLRITARTRLRIDDAVVHLMHKPVLRSVVLLGAVVAVQPLGLDAPWDRVVEAGLVSLAVLVWVPFAFRATTLLLKAASDDESVFQAIEPRTYPLFDNLAKVLLFGAFAYLVLVVVWRLDPAGFLASAGILGLAVGFAAQDTLANLFAGVFIIADAPYRVGDFITLDTGERGEVLQIGLRSTRILTRDDIQITIPNSVMGQAKITNEAGGPSPSHRVRVPVQCAYGSDVDRVRAALQAVARAEERVLDEPAPRVRFRSFGDSGLDFELLGWIPEPWMRGQTLDALNTAIYKRFAADGIEIPYPKRDVYLHRVQDEPEG